MSHRWYRGYRIRLSLGAFIGGMKEDKISEVSLRHLYNLINIGLFFALL
jgi:hypothetical protein